LSPPRSFVSGVAWNALLVGLGLPVGMAISILIGRWLGPAGKGEYTLAVTFGSLLLTGVTLGIPASISYHLGGGRAPAGPLLRVVLVLALALGLAAVGVAAVLDRTGWCRYVLGISRLSPAVWMIVATVPLQLLGMFLQFVILSLEHRVLFAVVPVAGQVLTLLLIGAFLLLGALSPFTAAAGVAIPYALSATFLSLFVKRRVASWRAPWKDLSLLQSVLRYSGFSYLGSLLQFLVQRVDVLLISVLLDLRAVGLYSVAYGVAELLLLLPQRFGNLYLTRVAGQTDGSALRAREIPLSTSAVVLGTLAAAAVLALAAPWAIRHFFGRSFDDSVKPFLLLLPGVCALAAGAVQNAYLSGAGRLGDNARVAAAGLVVNVALNLWLIPGYGIAGAAVASSLTYGLQALWLIHTVARLANARPLAMLTSAPPAVLWELLRRALR
jgi:O-antigen/teichoic acid export membrane protein